MTLIFCRRAKQSNNKGKKISSLLLSLVNNKSIESIISKLFNAILISSMQVVKDTKDTVTFIEFQMMKVLDKQNLSLFPLKTNNVINAKVFIAYVSFG